MSAFKLHAKLGPGWDIAQAPAPPPSPHHHHFNAFDYGEAPCEPLNPPAPQEPGNTEGCRQSTLESCLFRELCRSHTIVPSVPTPLAHPKLPSVPQTEMGQEPPTRKLVR